MHHYLFEGGAGGILLGLFDDGRYIVFLSTVFIIFSLIFGSASFHCFSPIPCLAKSRRTSFGRCCKLSISFPSFDNPPEK